MKLCDSTEVTDWIQDPSVRFFLAHPGPAPLRSGPKRERSKKRIQVWRSGDFRKTTLEVLGPVALLRLEVVARLSPRQRREMAKSFFRQIRPWLEYFTEAKVHQWDSAMMNFPRDEARGVRTFVSRGLDRVQGEVGYRIRMQRLRLGWSQEGLARRARVNRSHLSEIERGLSALQESTRLRLEGLLGISLEEMPDRKADSSQAREEIANIVL
ncbi:MAG: helix-turn-helix transcriptional regulator [Oligoflexia bacterium]|nr:helix-turn-helix transcriptional regulator [Oligoflexia bacterium]